MVDISRVLSTPIKTLPPHPTPMMVARVPANPPPGWTTDPDELDYEEEWAADESIGQQITAEYRLGRGRPVMYSPGGYLLMFEAGGKFYFWNRVDWGVYEIVSSTDLDEIIATMRNKGENALKSKAI